jgi:hypothetical protein
MKKRVNLGVDVAIETLGNLSFQWLDEERTPRPRVPGIVVQFFLAVCMILPLP